MADNGYNVEVGRRMRDARRSLRLSLSRVQEISQGEFRSSVLGAYERGDRRITIERLHRLAAIYGIPVERMLPPPDEPASSGSPDVIDLREPIDLAQVDRLVASDKQVDIHTLRNLAIELHDEAVRAAAMRIAAGDPMAIAEYRASLQNVVSLIGSLQAVATDLLRLPRPQQV
jgi:transcriptional regulator with XRE-family HTH domain